MQSSTAPDPVARFIASAAVGLIAGYVAKEMFGTTVGVGAGLAGLIVHELLDAPALRLAAAVV